MKVFVSRCTVSLECDVGKSVTSASLLIDCVNHIVVRNGNDETIMFGQNHWMCPSIFVTVVGVLVGHRM